MGEESRRETEYVQAISAVLKFIQAHLDDELTPSKLSDVAGFSQHHFHRVFRSVVGEAVMDHVRRLRLERAAYRLKTSQELIASVAFDAGYQAQESFTRSFQSHFGLGPRAFRSANVTHLVPAACGVHFSPRGFTALQRVVDFELLENDQLCEVHRRYPAEFEEQWEELMEIVLGFSELVYPCRMLEIPFHRIEDKMIETISDIDQEISALQNEVEAAKQRLVEARKRRPKEFVGDYILKDVEGADVRLSDLFGDKDDLILIHNMGTGCSYCTMWADGFTGLVPHLSDRAAFVVCSPDKPEVQKRFASKRNWKFRMISAHDSSFLQDMGFWKPEGPGAGPWPGVSTFRRFPDGQIARVAKTHFSPQDDFCAVWPLLDLLEEGPNGWDPKYSYEK